jgi:C4-dicarboxylate-specific signal transduction histidine kinase
MEVRAVRRWLVQSVVNLLANACDAVEEVEPERRWIRIELGRSGSEVRLVVEDGGRGIAAEVAPKLFQVFFSTKGEKGTGLGLALTRDQVERSGGHIEAGRAAGGGARFEIRLPALVPVAPLAPQEVAGPR